MAGASGSGVDGMGPEAVGRALRDCREAFGRSLEDVADATRIRVAYLEALEAGDYKAFPGEFWARLFLRSYAQQLGLPPDETIARAFGDGPPPPPPRVEREIPPPDPERADARAAETPGYQPRARGRGRTAAPPSGRRGVERDRRTAERLSALGPRAQKRQWVSPVLAVLAALVVTALLAGIVYNFLHARAPTAASTNNAPTAAGTGAHGSRAPGAHAGAGATHAKSAKGSRTGGGSTAAKSGSGTTRSTGSPTKGAGHARARGGYTTVAIRAGAGQATYRVATSPIRLHLTFRGRCWIGIRDAGSSTVVVDHTYAAGQSMDFTSARAIVVDVGATPLARGTLNGKAFGPWPTGRPWLLTLEP